MPVVVRDFNEEVGSRGRGGQAYNTVVIHFIFQKGGCCEGDVLFIAPFKL